MRTANFKVQSHFACCNFLCRQFHVRKLARVALLLVAGCGRSGPELAPVSGRVTLDGEPLESADVVFQPDEMKSPSFGRTDKNGRYELGYKRGVQGAMVGQHTVRIATATELTGGPQLVPARYHTKSELRREVEPGKKNVFDFELTSRAN